MTDDELLLRISVTSDVLSGKPVIRGTSLAVSFILNLLAHGSTPSDILQKYSGLTSADVQACLLYALKVFDDRGTYTTPETYGIARRAKAFYDEGIRVLVEIEENIGKMVVIDSDTGDYVIDKKGIDTSRQLQARHPGARLFGIRIGYNCAASLGGGMRRVDANAPPKKLFWESLPAKARTTET